MVGKLSAEFLGTFWLVPGAMRSAPLAGAAVAGLVHRTLIAED